MLPASGTPPEADARVVVAAVEAERPELAVAVAYAVNGARILVRVCIEDVLRAERQRESPIPGSVDESLSPTDHADTSPCRVSRSPMRSPREGPTGSR